MPKPLDEPQKTRQTDTVNGAANDAEDSLVKRGPDELESADEPPVVARLVVEIRSDGSRTIARGAMEDAQRGERVSVEARGDSPIQLAIALARALTQLPRLSARSAVRGLLGKRRDK